MYFDILNSPDVDFSTKKSILNFQKSLSDLETASKEKFKKSRKYDFSVDLSIDGKDIITGIAAGTFIDNFTNPLNIPIASVLGGLVSMIKVSAKSTMALESAQENSKLAYLCKASEERLFT